MKVSISWLNEWIDVSDLDPKDLAERLTMAGLEVDSIEFPGHGHDDIVVGQIKSIEDHPKADRLVVCSVDVGDGTDRTIVCGAKNMKAGDRVPVALPGSNPPGIDFGIEKRKVMGVASEGMLCSEEELELAEESEGLLILEENLTLGAPIFEALKMRDVILEIDLTPNRADCLSHLGVAREVAALYGRTLKEERAQVPALDGARGKSRVEIIDEEGCPQYWLAVLEGVEVGPSPDWLQRRLASVGQRTVNNVVDVTNFVLLDVGQPLHAFDLDKLEGNRVIVRRAKEGEKILAIDHDTYELATSDLVIADEAGPVAIAGVMGGADSEVSEETTRILLECAYFDPTTVRKSAKRHGIHSESSHRFERGIDAGAVESNLKRAVELLVRSQVESAGTKPTVGEVDLAGSAGAERWTVSLDVARTAKILGVDLSEEQCRGYLESIGLRFVESSDQGLVFSVPTHRADLERPIDLIEEVARLHGFEAIPSKLPRFCVGEQHRRRAGETRETILHRRERRVLDWLRGFLLDQQLSEAINYSFMGAEDLDRLGLEESDPRRQAPRVANPLVKDQALMRTTMIPSLLKNVKTNLAHRRFDVALFEIGRRYYLGSEERTLAMVVTGKRQRHWSGQQGWDFFDLKGIVEALATPFSLSMASWEVPLRLESYLHPGVQAQWTGPAGEVFGLVGQLHPAIAQKEEIEQPVFFAEIDLEALLRAGARQPQVSEPPKYPAVVRDFALLFSEDQPYKELEKTIVTLAGESEEFGALFESLELFDVYTGKQVPEGLRSLAVKVIYRSRERTLTEADVEAADRKLLAYLEEETGARLR